MAPKLTVSLLEARGVDTQLADVTCTLTLGKEKRLKKVRQRNHEAADTAKPRNRQFSQVTVASDRTGPIGSCSVKVSEIKGSIPGRFFPLVGNGWKSAGELSMALVLDMNPQTPRKSPQKGAKASRASQKGGKGFADDIMADLPALGLLLAAGSLAVSLALKKRQKAKTGPSLYEVQEGDTLCSIAACLNTSPKRIMELNTDIITNPNYIYPGERLRL